MPTPPLRPTLAAAAAPAWYLVTYAAQACLVPFLNIFFIRCGATRRQVGALAAARPLVAAATGNAWSFLADATGGHRALFVAAYIASGVSRYALRAAAPRGFAALLPAVLAMEALSSPVNILADAAVTAAAARGGDYGATRLFGAVGWGLFSPVGGWIIARAGVGAAFDANAAGWAMGLALAVALPMAALGRGGRASGDVGDRSAAPAPPLSPLADAPLVGAPELVSFDHHAVAASDAAAADAAATAPLLPSGDRGPPPSTAAALRAALATPDAALFLATAANFGAAMGAIDTWLFVYLDEALAAPPVLLGLTLTVTCMAEGVRPRSKR